MKTIRWKFVSSFVIATTGIMVFVLILFNIAVGIYFERNARVELKNTVATMNILIERQLMSSVVGNENANTDNNALISLSAALTASRMTGNTEFFIFDDHYALKFPVRTEGTMLSDSIMRQVRKYDFSDEGHIQRARTQEGVFFLSGMQIEAPRSGDIYLVFLSGMSVKHALLGAINMFLAAIMALSLAIGVISAMASAKSLVRPIKNVCRYAREIGNGNFLTVPPDNSSQETSELISDINEMSARLKSAGQIQKLFLQNASHELRTPLMSIQGYSEAIEQGIIADPKDAAAIIHAESIRLTSLVEELITLSKMDSNIYDRDFQPIDLGEAINDSIDRLNGLALKENKRIEPVLLQGIFVFADESLLSEVFGNVMSNCLRYAASTVSLQMQCTGHETVVAISDDGEGLNPEDIPHLFERFYKGKGGKFGLGLAIAKKALELLGGTIEAGNGDKGARFIIRLPVMG